MKLYNLNKKDKFILENDNTVYMFYGCDGMYGKFIPILEKNHNIEDMLYIICNTEVQKVNNIT